MKGYTALGRYQTTAGTLFLGVGPPIGYGFSAHHKSHTRQTRTICLGVGYRF